MKTYTDIPERTENTFKPGQEIYWFNHACGATELKKLKVFKVHEPWYVHRDRLRIISAYPPANNARTEYCEHVSFDVTPGNITWTHKYQSGFRHFDYRNPFFLTEEDVSVLGKAENNVQGSHLLSIYLGQRVRFDMSDEYIARFIRVSHAWIKFWMNYASE